MPPWLKIRSTGAEVAGTQYMELTNRRRGLNWSLPRMALTLAFGDADADSMYACSVQRRGAAWTTTVDVFLV
jgi:hypothetical protein